MTQREFAAMVMEMRLAQNAYFAAARSHDHDRKMETLITSKEWERKVDAAVRSVLAPENHAPLPGQKELIP